MHVKKPHVDEGSFVMMKSNGFRNATKTCHSFVKPPRQGDLNGQMAYIQEMIKRRKLTYSNQPDKDGAHTPTLDLKQRVQSADIFVRPSQFIFIERKEDNALYSKTLK